MGSDPNSSSIHTSCVSYYVCLERNDGIKHITIIMFLIVEIARKIYFLIKKTKYIFVRICIYMQGVII